MANYQFQLPTEEQAAATLQGRSYQAEMYRDALSCVRRLTPVTTAWEREQAILFTLPKSFSCTSCGRFAFPRPRRCYWCAR